MNTRLMKRVAKFPGMQLLAASVLLGCSSGEQAVDVTEVAEVKTAVHANDPRCQGADSELLLHVPSPEWQDQIIYMMLIDRFDDGNPDNNDQGAGEYDRFSGAHFTGGDLQGITNRLDYLRDLGATAIWLTPPVYNQWWSKEYEAAGWHGYWAMHFEEVDPHFGTLDDYRRLSHEMHCRDMYLIQDIVVNHVGNFYDYDGEYDPSDTAKNFFLIEEGHPTQAAPTQYPFNMVNRLDPEHAAADIYHWTPPIQDYADRHQELNYGLGTISDINTENPLVIETFKDSYEFWIREVGVDAFRIDTVMMVPVEFFKSFLHDENGIYARAKALGKEHFLTFGEVVAPPKPFEDAAEAKVASYLGTEDDPALNSMLGYPLYFTLKEVMSASRPTAELAYRLDTFMRAYRDPYVIPTFVDNHDTPRFLSGGNEASFKQALAVMMTIPGIPILLQGTEQGLPETRQTMFGPGYGSPQDNFNPESNYYKYVQEVSRLRTSNKVFTRGSMRQVASSTTGSGIFAYEREYEGEVALVLMNTAEHSIFVGGLETSLPATSSMEPMFSQKYSGAIHTDSAGKVTIELPGRAVIVVSSSDAVSVQNQTAATEFTDLVTVDSSPDGQTYSEDFQMAGSTAPGLEMQLVIDGNLDRSLDFIADEQGQWQVSVPVADLGYSEHQVQVYVPSRQAISQLFSYKSLVEQAKYQVAVDDANDDANGPTGNYRPPAHEAVDNQLEIDAAQLRSSGANLELVLTMKNITNVWIPPNGFDNVALSIFMDIDPATGKTELPLLNAKAPEGVNWDVGHFLNGWNNALFLAEDSTTEHRGSVLSAAPRVSVDKQDRTITVLYEGSDFGVFDWKDVNVYVSTWEANGEATLLPIVAETAEWYFSGAEPDDPKIMDDIVIGFSQ